MKTLVTNTESTNTPWMNTPWTNLGNVSIYIGLRFSISQRGSTFLSFITGVSIVGLGLGVMALIVVVSIMNGFDSQLKYRILGAVPHMVLSEKVLSDGGITPEEVLDSINPIKEIVASAPFLRRDGILIQSGANRLVSVYGIEPEIEERMSVIPQHIVSGSIGALQPGAHYLIVGKPLAAQLGLWIGDVITLLIPEPSKSGSTVVPKIAKLEVAGTFELQSELDYSLVLMNLEDLKQITGSETHEIRLTLDDIFQVGRVRRLLGTAVDISDWTEEYGDFFETVRMEKIMMFVLLTLIVAIAAFNTVSGLSMMVKEKQAEIAVLRTMGMSRLRIMQIFVVQGAFIGISGTLLGVVVGIPLAYHVTEVVGFFEDLTGARVLAGTYFDRVPTDVRLFDIIVIVIVSFVISILATLYPAYRAGSIEPAEVLRAE